MTFSSRRAQQIEGERRTMAEWSAFCMEEPGFAYTREEMALRLQFAQLETSMKIERHLDRLNNGRGDAFEVWLGTLTRCLRSMGLTFIPTYRTEIGDQDLRQGLAAAEQKRLEAAEQTALKLQQMAMAGGNPVAEPDD